jgi:hypothetical protein
MHVVAILDSDPEAASHAEELARTLSGGIAALELRMAMSAIHPSILLRTASRERAEEAAAILVARGVGAVVVDLTSVTSLEQMVHLHRFAFETDGLRADDHGPILAYEAMAAIIRAAVETSVWRTTREGDTKIGPRGTHVHVLTDVTRTEHAIEQVLFVVARDGGIPWVLRASEARYLALGAGLRPTVVENFVTTVGLLRARAPRAIYDERFVSHPLVRQAEVHVRGHETPTHELGDPGIEVRVHLLAQTLGRGSRTGPYR